MFPKIIQRLVYGTVMGILFVISCVSMSMLVFGVYSIMTTLYYMSIGYIPLVVLAGICVIILLTAIYELGKLTEQYLTTYHD
jgi:hypothetical protein